MCVEHWSNNGPMRLNAYLARYRDKDFTLTDATCFAIMERLGIGAAFTFDDDFRQYGVVVLDGSAHR